MFFPESQSSTSRRERREHDTDVRFRDDLVQAAKNLGPLAVHDIVQGVKFAMTPDMVHLAEGVFRELEEDEEKVFFIKSLARAEKIGIDRYARVSSAYASAIDYIEAEVLFAEPVVLEEQAE